MIVWNLLMRISEQQSLQGIHFLQNYLRNRNPIPFRVLTTPGRSNTHSSLSPHVFYSCFSHDSTSDGIILECNN